MLINKKICFLRGSLPQIQTQRGQPPASIDSKGWEMSKVREKREKNSDSLTASTNQHLE